MDRPLSSLLQDLRLPGHKQVAEHWLSLFAACGQRVPPLKSLDPIRFPKALADCWVVDAEADGGFRIRLAGETTSAWYGFNPKGRSYDQLFGPEVLPIVVAQSRRIVETPSIGYQRMRTTVPDWSVPAAFERIALPLADAEGKVRHLLGATLFSSGSDHGRGGLAATVDADYWYAIPAPAGV